MGDRHSRQVALTDGAHELIDFASTQRPANCSPLGLHHWMLALIECQPTLVQHLAPAIGDLADALQHIYARLCVGDIGEAAEVDDLLSLAGDCAQQRDSVVISERDLACVILAKAGYTLSNTDAPDECENDCETIYVSFADDDENAASSAPEPDTGATPLLDKLGIDLTRAAREGTLSPIIGRQQEIELVVETLCRRTKRNPALVGPAGVGKTAIVEGLAQRIARSEVPAALQSLRIIMLPVCALVASCKYVGEFEERMLALLREASQPGIILFIDEAHTIMGAGSGGRNGNDLANIIKPAMARGDIACIAATTDEEYRLNIEADSALERRFQPVRVQELSPQETLEILTNLRDQLAQLRGVEVPKAQLDWIVNFAGQYLHNRYFPDKAVDILEQCVAYGVTQEKQVLAQSDIEVIAQRMVGMPLALNERLVCLNETLTRRSLLPADTITALVNRLQVTMRGFDLRTMRPNAVLLLVGDASTQSHTLAELIAECLFGTPERLVSFDFTRFITHADTTMLIGSPPGYVGYEGRVTLHQVVQMPWCVLRCENLHAGHPSARDILTHGLNEGLITLADGKRVFLSDTVVIMTADISARNPLGFGQDSMNETESQRERAAHLLGTDLIEQVDLICDELRADPTTQQQWLQESLLADLCLRFRPQGVQLCFDQSLYPWLLSRGAHHFTQADWERLIEDHLCPAIIPHLPATRPQSELLLHVKAEGDCCRVELG